MNFFDKTQLAKNDPNTAAAKPALTKETPVTLKLGSTGTAVVDLQKALAIPADGVFGPQTKQALVAYQASHGLVADGEYGPLTAAKLAGASPAPAPTPAPTGKIKVVDVSHWEPSVDYAKVAAAGYDGVIAKITEGVNYFDPSFDYHDAHARAAGFPRIGAYHFLRYNVDGVSQAKWFLKHAQGRTGLFICDIEWKDGLGTLGEAGAKIAKDFLDYVEQATGNVCWIYTNRNFMVGFSHPERFAKYPLWLNDFSVPLTGTPHAPAPWIKLISHQYQYDPKQTTPTETVPGAGKVDVSWVYLSRAEFDKECAV